MKLWEHSWEKFTPFPRGRGRDPPVVRTVNTIESLTPTGVKARRYVPNEQAIYVARLAGKGQARWSWRITLNAFNITITFDLNDQLVEREQVALAPLP